VPSTLGWAVAIELSRLVVEAAQGGQGDGDLDRRSAAVPERRVGGQLGQEAGGDRVQGRHEGGGAVGREQVHTWDMPYSAGRGQTRRWSYAFRGAFLFTGGVGGKDGAAHMGTTWVRQFWANGGQPTALTQRVPSLPARGNRRAGTAVA
jgi:hypothetical protein